MRRQTEGGAVSAVREGDPQGQGGDEGMNRQKGRWETEDEIAARWGVSKSAVGAMMDKGYVDWERDPRTDRYMAVKRKGRPAFDPSKYIDKEKISGTGAPYTLEDLLLAVTLPLWIIPKMLYDAFNPPPGGGIDYVEQECKQWLYGTGKYANRD